MPVLPRRRIPAVVPLAHEAFALKSGKDSVEVVLFDTHRFRELGDRDTRPLVYELEHLLSAGPTLCVWCLDPGKHCGCGLEPLVLEDERPQLV